MRSSRSWTVQLLLIALMTQAGMAGCGPAMPTSAAESRPALTWKGDLGEGCQTVLIDPQGQADFGPCSGPGEAAPILPEVERPRDLGHFLDSYRSFAADTSAGSVVFAGNGARAAGPSQQRAVAEWAALVNQELQSGRSGASWGLAAALTQEGPNPCSRIQVEVYGKVFANECSQGIQPYPIVWLSAEQLDRLYLWLDKFQPVQINWNEDDLPLSLVLSGRGTQTAGEADRDEILAWVLELYESIAR